MGHILGGTPRSMQIGDFLGIFVASALLYFPLLVLHEGNIKAGGIGFGDRSFRRPQAGLMASLAQGIVGGDMPWPLVVVGHLHGLRADHGAGAAARCCSRSACTCRWKPPSPSSWAASSAGSPTRLRDTPRLQRRAEGAHRKRRRADGLGPDRRGGADRAWWWPPSASSSGRCRRSSDALDPGRLRRCWRCWPS